MAWNRNDSANRRNARAPQATRTVVWVLCAVAALLAAAVAAWRLWPADGENPETVKAKKPSHIREVAPSLPAPRAQGDVSSQGKEEKRPKVRPPQQLGEVRDGYVLLGSGLHKIRGEVTNNCSLTRGRYEIFKHSAENTIAGLLSMKAGDLLVGEPDYQGSFAESLRRSLKEPIEIEETDTPEQVELKQAVIEAKEELKKAMDRGEDVEKIIIEARRECQDLARAKQLMMSDVYHFVDKKAVTQEDVEIYVEAANKLLESKGIAPIERSALADIKLRHALDDYDPETEETEENEEDP
ncbi:MAG: hypothetical protein IJG13_00190 [Kiritimatiellae bacterium]|nr:hypothetical protein [Kiritimatiellia bacterium]